MKNQEFLGLAISSLFLIAQRLFAPAHSRVLGATAGILTPNLAASTDDDMAAEAVGAEQPTATVGSLVANTIEAARATGAKRILVTGIAGLVRTLRAYPIATDIFNDGSRILRLERDLVGDETVPSKVAPWTVTEDVEYNSGDAAHVALKAAVQEILATRKPTYSLAGLISKLEDLKDGEGDRLVGELAVDQTGDGSLHVMDAAVAPATPEVTIVQDITPVVVDEEETLPFE